MKIHALVGRQGRLMRLKLTAGQHADVSSAHEMIAELPARAVLLPDKGYDANAVRQAC
jgi:hypothetical protein